MQQLWEVKCDNLNTVHLHNIQYNAAHLCFKSNPWQLTSFAIGNITGTNDIRIINVSTNTPITRINHCVCENINPAKDMAIITPAALKIEPVL